MLQPLSLPDLDIRSDAPLLIVDVDEVLAHFMAGFERYVRREGYEMRIDRFALFQNLYRPGEAECLDFATGKDLFDRFFRDGADDLDPVEGAADALASLSTQAGVVILTNAPAHALESRTGWLSRHGFDYPMILHSGLKGPTIAQMASRTSGAAAFIDDLLPNLESSAESAPDVRRFQIIADPRLRPYAPTAPDRHGLHEDWTTLGPALGSGAGRREFVAMIALALALLLTAEPTTTTGDKKVGTYAVPAWNRTRPADWTDDASDADLLAAAERNDPDALRALGRRSETEDPTMAMSWYQRAVEQGSGPAASQLGLMYEEGRGAPANLEAAAALYRRAIALDDVNGMVNYAAMLADGRGVSENDAMALQLMQAAHDRGVTIATVNLGVLYETGQGVAQDAARACDYYRLAAESEEAAGVYYLGKCYWRGDGVPQDREKAVELYWEAHDLGAPAATAALARLYLTGEQVEKDLQVGDALLREAARRGDPAARRGLASSRRGGAINP